MTISKPLSDEAILAEIGQRVVCRRLDLQYTQADVAEQAGIAKRTVERLEAGFSVQMSTLIRIFRVLDLLPGLDRMIPEAGPRPMDLLKRKGKVRKRASSRRPSDRSDKPWTWGDVS
ncbi:MAG: helix-turn-helix transcriptional regulator [Nitrospira sp.]|nr:helix-turn-helix domain-containing protein [Candidatus Manganitrophaceae bacterium]HIL34171.1 helix-turn-helix domain-containing protein [Candidatus Manganitrophaceae bacterium]